ncbi:hypothetical protein CGSSp23BS72_06439 [Streptococcus pneumoniae SP23-BS72]|nr:peptide chain release factor 2 [Streptococcus pneumoniae SP11-BS70]EDK67753.1 hypothetical protein CGSSp18BS74_04026 [Streptococcus pneumoniae SP18-BS74]EDK73640.1 hypothetical protein CGSSp3BS71_08946 [Streptococcus pneumoniae SP3-BS71]EDK75853.1 hypothetical protein CGSSp6BS73_01533 [Streptococcus pneumoniae SP6-BS73]EDK81673.1 hypothetical protein CGSSp23BS72_06439 [Streptococcus pneumoniae SP23-BS72]
MSPYFLNSLLRIYRIIRKLSMFSLNFFDDNVFLSIKIAHKGCFQLLDMTNPNFFNKFFLAQASDQLLHFLSWNIEL